MNQFALLHFTLHKNDRIYQVVLQPGYPWEDLEVVLDDFKKEFASMKEEANKPKEEVPEVPLEVVS
jgi:hypothetical protein